MEQHRIFKYKSKASGQSEKGRLFFNSKDDSEGFSLTAVINAEDFANGELACSYVFERLGELYEELCAMGSAQFEELKQAVSAFLNDLDSELCYISKVKGREYSAFAGLCLTVSNSVIAAAAGPVQCCVLSGGILRFLTPRVQDGPPLGSGKCSPEIFDAVLYGQSCVLLSDAGSCNIPAPDIAAALKDASDRSLSDIALQTARSGARGRRLLVCTSLQRGDAR